MTVFLGLVWQTTSWVMRHFAEGLGFWEVNTYRALTYFYPEQAAMSHTEFRRRLAWALLTLGEKPYPADGGSSSADSPAAFHDAGAFAETRRHDYTVCSKHACGYCGRGAYQYCASCEEVWGVARSECALDALAETAWTNMQLG